MSDRFTSKDVERMLGVAARMAEQAGAKSSGEEWILTRGVGAYELHVRDERGHHSAPFSASFGYIGRTAREAYRALEFMAYAWRAVVDRQGGLS